jgi:hypothetical protein
MNALHIKERNKQLRSQLKVVLSAHSNYMRTYRRWNNALKTGKTSSIRDLEMELDSQVKQATEAYNEAGRKFKILRWWLNFGE